MPPIIDLNLLSKDEDRQTLLRGVKLLRRILASPALSGSGAQEVVPGPAVQSDDELLQFIFERLGTGGEHVRYSPAHGSCG